MPADDAAFTIANQRNAPRPALEKVGVTLGPERAWTRAQTQCHGCAAGWHNVDNRARRGSGTSCAAGIRRNPAAVRTAAETLESVVPCRSGGHEEGLRRAPGWQPGESRALTLPTAVDVGTDPAQPLPRGVVSQAGESPMDAPSEPITRDRSSLGGRRCALRSPLLHIRPSNGGGQHPGVVPWCEPGRQTSDLRSGARWT